MTPEDWPAVEAIYAEGIATREATFETETPTWAAFDAGRMRAHRLVAVSESRVVGWAALSPPLLATATRALSSIPCT
jgi:phosphinothricin acetyltransferase